MRVATRSEVASARATFSDESKHVINERAAEGLREAALLWFVFSALDALITGRLTLLWATANTSGALGVWLFSIYIEIRAKGKT